MEMNGQLHASATLLPGKEPLVHIENDAGWATELVRMWKQKEKSLQLLGSEPQLSSS